MFIPNKTYHVMRLGVLGIIATLLLTIVIESALYVKLTNKHTAEIMSLTARLDSLQMLSSKIDKNSVNRDSQVQNQITDAVTIIAKLNESLESTKSTIQILVSNECQIRPYYMDKRLSEMCSR